MLESFTLEMPQGILFGPGTRQRIPELLKRYGKRVLLLTGRGWFARSGWREDIGTLLEPFEVLHLACPGGEPDTESLERILHQARELDPEVLLAVGGGSVIDTAKAVSGLLHLHDQVEDYLEGVGRGLQISSPGIPWIAVPTTAGTGAEATKNAVIRTRAMGYKRSLRSPFLLAACAVVDPEASRDCPPALTGVVGMDALTQLVESFVSRKAAPIPRALARQAFPVMFSALKVLAGDPGNLAARTGAAYGALISGICLANAGLGGAHGFASGLGGMYDIPHGLICALFLRPVLRFNASAMMRDCELLRQSVRELEDLPGLRAAVEGGTGAANAVEWLIAEVDGLFRLYGLPESFKGFAIDPKDIPEIARRSSGSSMSGNPLDIPMEERERIIAGLL